LLLIQVGDAPGPPNGRRRGLYHIGIKVGDSLDELRQAKRELEQAGIAIDGMSDHTVSQSLYLKDPDENEIELYVDADESVWKNNPAAVVSPIKPLRLSNNFRRTRSAPSLLDLPESRRHLVPLFRQCAVISASYFHHSPCNVIHVDQCHWFR
jgi:catechol-2,3-dioxygenase